MIKKIRKDPSAISKLFKEGKYPYTDSISRSAYSEEKAKLQIELLKVQNWVKLTGQKIVVIFEGRDAAGKGGAIKRFTEHLNPRAAKVVALEKPTEREMGEWYFQRYVNHLPTKGEILFFDRSWYNRAGVERVMGFCNQIQYLEFMRECPELERMLVNSGIKLFKFYFSVTKKEQRARFDSRLKDPLKQWKLSAVDEAAMGLWHEYTLAKESMFFHTDTAASPWTIIKSDDKKRARLNCMQHFLSELDYPGKDSKVVTGSDPLIVGSPKQILRPDIHLDSWPN
jgi:polyphosphate kinase 2